MKFAPSFDRPVPSRHVFGEEDHSPMSTIPSVPRPRSPEDLPVDPPSDPSFKPQDPPPFTPTRSEKTKIYNYTQTATRSLYWHKFRLDYYSRLREAHGDQREYDPLEFLKEKVLYHQMAVERMEEWLREQKEYRISPSQALCTSLILTWESRSW